MSKGMSVFFHFRIWSRSLAHKEDIETEESSYRNAIHNEVPPEVLKLHTSCWVFTQAGLLPSKGQRRVSRTCLVCPFQVTISEMYGICGKTCFIHPNGKRTYTKDKGAFVTACVASLFSYVQNCMIRLQRHVCVPVRQPWRWVTFPSCNHIISKISRTTYNLALWNFCEH